MKNRKKTFAVIALVLTTVFSSLLLFNVANLASYIVLFSAFLVAGVVENKTVCHSTKSNNRSSYSATKA